MVDGGWVDDRVLLKQERVKNGKKMGKHWDTQKKVWKI